MVKNKKPGVITVFGAVSLVLIATLLLSLLEASRAAYITPLCAQQMQCATSEYMGQYNKELLEDYGIYGVHSDLWQTKEELLESYGRFYMGSADGLTFLYAFGPELEQFQYRLLTDDGGRDFRKQAVTHFLYEIPKDYLAELKEQLGELEGLGGESFEEGILEDAEEAIEEAEKRLEENKKQGIKKQREASVMSEKKDVENPIEEMKDQKASFYLQSVLPKDFTISEGKLSRSEKLEEQQLQKGNLASEDSAFIEDNLLFPFYLQKNFGHCLKENTSETSVLKYQQEYFIAGKSTDAENLEEVVNRLILIRELSWFAYRLSDNASRQEAAALATAIVGVVNMPALEKPVELAILLAWSYTDAINDVKQLLAGEEVKLWPGISGTKTSDKGNTETESQLDKVTYEDYLLILMIMKEKETLTYRAFDVMEELLNEQGGGFEANKTVTEIKGVYKYEMKGLFFLFSNGDENGGFPILIKHGFHEEYY